MTFELFSGPDFVAALYEHIPPKGFQTLRYYGIYSNKARGMQLKSQVSSLSPQNTQVSSFKSQPSKGSRSLGAR